MVAQIEISFADSAVGDFEEVLEYYKKAKIPHVGERLVAQIIKDIELLGQQPEMGRVVPEFEVDDIRELIRPPFRIVYRMDRNQVRIVRIWRSERLLILPE
jgi:plasmid stabilization system protein ParE